MRHFPLKAKGSAFSKGSFKTHALQVLLMGSISKILPIFMEITVTTPFNEQYHLRCHVPSEDTSKSFITSLKESALNSSHGSCIVMSTSALVVSTNLLIILS